MVQSIEDYSLQNISNQINWRQSQISVLHIKFPGFFTGKQYMQTPMKVSIKVQRIIGPLSRMRSRMSITFKCIFSGEDHLCCFFLQKSNIIFVTFVHIYRKYHTSMYFLRKIIFHFPSEEKLSYFQKKKKYHLST